jgi:uncharacterized membrane protein
MPAFQPFGARLSKITSIGVVAVFVLYPLLVYLGLRYLGGAWVAVILIALCLLRLVARTGPFTRAQVVIICSAGVLLAVLSLLRGSPKLVLYYPVLINAGLLIVFARSLAYPPTVIERLARLRDPQLSPKGVAYTRRVTIAWVAFFLLNGGAALYTASFSSPKIWALYNGFIAYVLMGAMFAGEFLVRMYVQRSSES